MAATGRAITHRALVAISVCLHACRSVCSGRVFACVGLHRAEALVEANRDTSDLIRQYTNSSGYHDVGRTYQLDLKIKGFEASGSRLKKFSATWVAHGSWIGGLVCLTCVASASS
jgi:hypothetical protein